MSRLILSCLLAVFAGCEGAGAELEGTAGGIQWGSSDWVYVGARYVIISQIEVECRDIDWIERNYDEGVAPTDNDASLLQLAFSSSEEVQAGRFPVAQGGQVEGTIVNVTGDVFNETAATGGTLDVDSVEQDGVATGTFEALTFDDGGTLSGSFTAEWCVNLKP